MSRTDRLSALDSAFLALDSPSSPLHVGWTLRFAGSAPPLAQLRRHLEARLHLVPRFRRRVVRPRFGLGDPGWVDDAGFDIARHVHRVALPGDAAWPAELREVAGSLLSTPLDPERPLWRLYLVDRVGDGFALVGQAHHALVDGVAAIEVAMLLFGPAADSTAAGWVPAPAPSAPGGARDALVDRARAGADAGRWLARTLAQGPGSLDLTAASRALEDVIRAVPRTPLDAPAGPDRAVAFAEVDLEDARAAGRRHGATLNDVLLAATSMALVRTLRAGRDPARSGDDVPSPPPAVKVLVPVSTRGDGDAADLGNRISFMAVTLPVGEPDPVRVLRRVRDQTRAAKGRDASGPLDALARGADLLPAAVMAPVARTAYRMAAFNAVVSNVPGPPVELELLGRPLRAIHPAVPVAPGHALSVGAVSYAGRLHVGLLADRDAMPDVVDVARDLERAFDVLRAADGPMPAPWRARALERRRQRAASR